ncbi:hypothetical protein PR048_012616 [Dryococelus australis]|uniref:Uncharacterized protein n=1 Tax=Dryococelus australis TaxID=614101 RepID=A0ABQ9HQH9_9NEOP|nr:hypothetical protein PR048_012616 [Dryococelus australis]
MNVVGPWTHMDRCNKYILTFQDAYSNYPKAICLPDQKSEAIARAFYLGMVPQNSFDSLRTTVYHPACNGEVREEPSNFHYNDSSFIRINARRTNGCPMHYWHIVAHRSTDKDGEEIYENESGIEGEKMETMIPFPIITVSHKETVEPPPLVGEPQPEQNNGYVLRSKGPVPDLLWVIP